MAEKLSFKEHQAQQRKKGIIVIRNPENTHKQEIARRKEDYHGYQDTMPKLVKEELTMNGKYIPAGQYKNLQPHNR